MTQAIDGTVRIRRVINILRKHPADVHGRVNIGSRTYTYRMPTDETTEPVWGFRLTGCREIKITLWYERDSKRLYLLANGRTAADLEQTPGTSHGTTIFVKQWSIDQTKMYSIDELPISIENNLCSVLGIR